MEPATPSSATLSAAERRVLGVLLEKGLSTPEYYPMTLNAVVAGCNQKNNRDPLTQYDSDLVETTLRVLEQRGLAASVIADTGRVNRWRQDLGRKFELNAVQLSVVGELLLRGPQSEGDLRGRANRMRPIDTLETLRDLLQQLRSKVPPLVVRLTPEGAARGVRWTHALYPPDELARIAAQESASDGPLPRTNPAERAQPAANEVGPRRAGASLEELLARMTELEARVARLEAKDASA